ncbi:siderophore-interacting protein [Nesterenkonia alba]|uniref:siderophore-interacting protein n=1 Tax=Nesterenkonia alba TaxID=515814 RepID=UPI0003B3F8FA|nr:siderophore-interacting protein [Nesterenkonia alba]
MTPAPRKPRRQHLLTVQHTEHLTPHMVRVVLGGDGFSGIEFKEDTDQYIKLLFADPALGLQRPYDLDALRDQLPQDQMPVTRTYTIRHIDRERQHIWVDFVIHGDEGIAGPWAAGAQPGDQISFFGPGSGYAPRPEADWHLLAGDESALPAIAASVESMPAQAQGLALIEVRDAAEEQPIAAPAGVEVRWLHRGADFSPETTQLTAAVAEVEIPSGDVQIFIHGEREQMKAIRRNLVKERGVDRRGMSLSAYWAYGRVEDQFQAEKRTPVGQIDED